MRPWATNLVFAITIQMEIVIQVVSTKWTEKMNN